MTRTRPPRRASHASTWQIPEGTHSMRKLSLLFLLRALATAAALALSIPGGATVLIMPVPFADGDPTPGRPLNQRSCVHCRTWPFGSVVDRIYFRRDRLARAPRVLVVQAN